VLGYREMHGGHVKKLFVAALLAALVSVTVAFSGSQQTAGPKQGVVVVNTRIAYGGVGAGTGIVLTSSGQVLTNNHIIRGAAAIRVTVPSSGRTYDADVVGYSVAKDIALLQLENATGLQTVTTGNSASVQVGDGVTAVGNAGGTGVLTTKHGKVTGLRTSLTVDDDTLGPTRMTGLIETNTRLQPGDSGGPLISGGKVVGIDAATSRSFNYRGVQGRSYSIPIGVARQVLRQIATGTTTAVVHVGPTAFLGVALADANAPRNVRGALVDRVASGTPAARAGLGSGDVITSFAGRQVASENHLRSVILQVRPGANVRVVWVDAKGSRTSASIKLATGPPQ
jgi:S1-C subfamily serine protease